MAAQFTQATGRVDGKQSQQPAPDVEAGEEISRSAVLGGANKLAPNFDPSKEKSFDKAKAARVVELDKRGEGDTEESQYIRRDISDKEGVLDRSNAYPDDVAKMKERVDAAVILAQKRVDVRPIGKLMRETASQAYAALWDITAPGMTRRAFAEVASGGEAYKQLIGQPSLGEVLQRKDYQYWRKAVQAFNPIYLKYQKLRTAAEADVPAGDSEQPRKRREQGQDYVRSQVSGRAEMLPRPPMAPLRPQITQQPVPGIPGAYAHPIRVKEADILGD